jgi:uncharacterized membrane protein (DUF485 family)
MRLTDDNANQSNTIAIVIAIVVICCTRIDTVQHITVARVDFDERTCCQC